MTEYNSESKFTSKNYNRDREQNQSFIKLCHKLQQVANRKYEVLTKFLQDPESQIKVSGETFFVDSIDSRTVIDNLLHFDGQGQHSGRTSIFSRKVNPDDDLNDLEEILNHHNLLDIVSSSRWDNQHHHDG